MIGNWVRAPRRLRLVFVGVMLLLASTLGWLAWRLLTQDEQLAAQRLTDQRDTAADLTVATLEKRLSTAERELGTILASGAADTPGNGAIFAQLQPGSIHTWPESSLIYYPDLPEKEEAPSALFAAAEQLEFARSDYSGAIAALGEFARSADPKVRAAALVRIARNYLKAGQGQKSLEVYARLSELGSVQVGGMPSALAGLIGKLSVLEMQKDQASLAATSLALKRELNSAHWPISFASYQYLSGQIDHFLPEADRLDSPKVAMAEGIEWLWQKWTTESSSLVPGRVSLQTAAGPVLMVWQVSGNSVAAFAAHRDYLSSQWLAELNPMLDARQVRLALTNREGAIVFGSAPAASDRLAVRLASTTQLPWTIQALNTGGDDTALHSRRALLAGGLAVLAALIITGGWFIGRTVSRELAVARLQSDFVSAVSHEFRTPLTTLCQLSELLKRGRVAEEGDRQQYYEFLNQESHRLRRLVESLLNFGRLEAGKLQFRFEELNAAELVRQSATEFSEATPALSHRFLVETHAATPVVHADRETLRCVLWNLFENAVKYSPGCDTVWVELEKNGTHVEIAVRDRGVGIPRNEQRRIFERFVRGSSARENDIRGTGIGLAMARQIVRAHGGDITVESEPGKGSTFRVLLPV